MAHLCIHVYFSDSKQRLDEIKTQVAQATNDIPLSALTNVSKTLEQVQGDVIKVTPEIKRVEHIR